jgi:hypothetical protein
MTHQETADMVVGIFLVVFTITLLTAIYWHEEGGLIGKIFSIFGYISKSASIEEKEKRRQAEIRLNFSESYERELRKENEILKAELKKQQTNQDEK